MSHRDSLWQVWVLSELNFPLHFPHHLKSCLQRLPLLGSRMCWLVEHFAVLTHQHDVLRERTAPSRTTFDMLCTSSSFSCANPGKLSILSFKIMLPQKLTAKVRLTDESRTATCIILRSTYSRIHCLSSSYLPARFTREHAEVHPRAILAVITVSLPVSLGPARGRRLQHHPSPRQAPWSARLAAPAESRRDHVRT